MLTNKNNIIIYIGSEFMGLWLGIAKLLSSEYKIIIVTTNSFRQNMINSIVPNANYDVVLKKNCCDAIASNEMHRLDVVNEAVVKEHLYGETFSMIMASDRGLGKGYIFNADKHPDIIRSWWSHERKVKEVLTDFLFWENIIEEFSPLLILSQSHIKILSLIARSKRIVYLSLGFVKYSNRMMWVENEYYQNAKFIDRIKKGVAEYDNSNRISSFDYIKDQMGDNKMKDMSYSYLSAIKQILLRTPYEIVRLFTGYHKKNQGYRFMGWYPTIIRKPFIYNYLKKNGRKVGDLKGYRLVYFPLNLEPEIALLLLSPEFSNSQEIIAWISKSLPTDTLLVVKENPLCFGIRSRHYYDNLRRMSNVVIGSPDVSSWEWIQNSSIVATITGAAGIEAVHFEKPVLSYGKHQIINNLPTVRYASDFSATKKALNELLLISVNDSRFKTAKEALFHAQIEVSFEMPFLTKRLIKGKDLRMDLAEIAVMNLKQQYGL